MQQLAPDQEGPHRTPWAGGDSPRTGRNRPIRSSRAIPRASLRAVLTTVAASAASTCRRVSSRTAWTPAAAGPACAAAATAARPLQSDPGHRQAELVEEPHRRLRLARHPGLADDPPGGGDRADAAPFQRPVDPGPMLHGCPSMRLGVDPPGPRSHTHALTLGDRRPAGHAPAQARYMA